MLGVADMAACTIKHRMSGMILLLELPTLGPVDLSSL